MDSLEGQSEFGRRTLKWHANIEHHIVSRLRAQIVLTLGGALGSTSVPACCIEVWAESDQGAVDQSILEELAYCHGLILHGKDLSTRVIWLGRSASRAIDQSVRGKRCLVRSGKRKGAEHSITVAEAVLGITVSIAKVFGALNIELQASDNGSGRLIDFYRNAGFSESAKVTGAFKWMEAPACVVSRLAPHNWVKDLVPRQFEALPWLHKQTLHLWLERFETGKLPRWEWMLVWPRYAQMFLKMARSSFRHGCLVMEALVSNNQGVEVACCRCVARLDQQLLLVLWMGNTYERPVHHSVKGHPSYRTSIDSVTAAVALLGILASVACWFGVVMVELQALDSGSGKLVQYLRDFGFAESSHQRPVANNSSRSCVWLSTPCDELSRRCCPADWRNHLLEEPDRDRFILYQKHHNLSLADQALVRTFDKTDIRSKSSFDRNPDKNISRHGSNVALCPLPRPALQVNIDEHAFPVLANKNRQLKDKVRMTPENDVAKSNEVYQWWTSVAKDFAPVNIEASEAWVDCHRPSSSSAKLCVGSKYSLFAAKEATPPSSTAGSPNFTNKARASRLLKFPALISESRGSQSLPSLHSLFGSPRQT